MSNDYPLSIAPIPPAVALRIPRVRPAGDPEEPVFFDGTGRRGRRVRHVGRLAVAVTAAWLAALVLGALAPGQLPAIPLHVARAHGVGATQALANRAMSPAGRSAPRLTVAPDIDELVHRA